MSNRTVCPECGGKKHPNAKRCWKCRYPNPPRDRTKKGHPRQATSPDYSDLDPLWAAEFCGLFMGEGCVLISRRKLKSGKWTYSIALNITLRSDDSDCLYGVVEHLGGRLNHYIPYDKGHPKAVWTITGFARCQAVLALLARSRLKAKKLRDVRLALEFIAWRNTWGCRLGDEGRVIAQRYFDQLKEIRKFNS